MLELAEMEISEYLEKTSLHDAPIIPVSSITGDGIEQLKSEIHSIALQTSVKKSGSTFRMYTDRYFNIKGHGLVVTGSVLNGVVTVGSDIFPYPGKGEKLKVRGIERHGKSISQAVAGDRAALNITGLKQAGFKRGMLLLGQEMEPTAMIDANLELFDGIMKLGVWSHVLFHTGTFYCKARIHLLDKDILQGSESAIVQIHLDKPSILLNKDKFIIRNSANDITLGGGTIVDNKPLHHRRRTDRLIAGMQQLVSALLDEENLEGLIRFALSKNDNLTPLKKISDAIDVPVGEIKDAVIGQEYAGLNLFNFDGQDFLASDQYLHQLSAKILEILAEWHKSNPLFSEGFDLKELSGKTALVSGIELQFLQSHLNKMVSDGQLKIVGATWALANHKVKIDPRTKEQLAWLEYKISGYGIQKPTLKELGAKASEEKISKGKLKMLLSFLGREGKIYFNGEDFIETPLLNSIRTKLFRELLNKPRGINEKEFRLLIDCTKKMAQVLINIFTGEGVIEKQKFYLFITDKGREMMK
jgi:selenocysteine-specific elongation factor